MKHTLKKLFSVLLTLALAVSLAACGAPEKKDGAGETGGTVYKVGIVQYLDDASLNQIEQNIELRLDELGAELGVTFDYRDYTYNGQGDPTTLNQIGAELISEEVDVIIPIATPAAQIMQSATEETDIPIVFAASSDPVTARLVGSMEEPGGRITGTSDSLNTGAILDIVLALNPETDYVGLLYSKSEDSSKKPIADAIAYLEAKGIRYIEKTGTTNDEISSAADALIAEKVDAVFTPTDNTVMKAQLGIYEKLLEAGIPQFCGADSFALNGAFLGYGVDYAQLGRATAELAVRVLTEGADPASTPVVTFDNGIAVVNTESAAALGLALPEVHEKLKGHCTEVTETVTALEFAQK